MKRLRSLSPRDASLIKQKQSFINHYLIIVISEAVPKIVRGKTLIVPYEIA